MSSAAVFTTFAPLAALLSRGMAFNFTRTICPLRVPSSTSSWRSASTCMAT